MLPFPQLLLDSPYLPRHPISCSISAYLRSKDKTSKQIKKSNKTKQNKKHTKTKNRAMFVLSDYSWSYILFLLSKRRGWVCFGQWFPTQRNTGS